MRSFSWRIMIAGLFSVTLIVTTVQRQKTRLILPFLCISLHFCHNNAGIVNGTKTLLLTLTFFFFEAWPQNIFNLQIWQLSISWCCSVTTTFNIHVCYISSKSWSGIFIWNPDILTLFWRPFCSFFGNSVNWWVLHWYSRAFELFR